MLQQTHVERVLPKYHEWLKNYPTFEDLAAASLDDVKQLWRPLGYNIRPERLYQIARFVMGKCDGSLPHTYEELIALPGVGRATAGAILNFAFHKDAPIVDTNVQRVILRIFGLQGNPRRATVKKRVWQLAKAIIPKGKGYVFNQALIDFGALLFTARNPACFACFNQKPCVWNTRHHE
jgi:A/G-specific adenine glycosylase